MRVQTLAILFNLTLTQPADGLTLEYTPIDESDFRETICEKDDLRVRFKNFATSDIPAHENYMMFYMPDNQFNALWRPMLTLIEPEETHEEYGRAASIDMDTEPPVTLYVRRPENVRTNIITMPRNDYERLFNQVDGFGITPTGWACTSRVYEPSPQD